MFQLASFSLRNMAECGQALRQTSSGAGSMEDAATRIVRYLRDNLVDEQNRPSAALIRMYKTHPYGELPADLQKFAAGVFGSSQQLTDSTKCLTLLATTGDEEAWNARSLSKGHQAIPLPSEQVVLQLPMIAQLVRQFGLEVTDLVRSDRSLLVDQEQTNYNVFFVEEAHGSPFIPAQNEFVVPYGIRSVLGFGGLLYTGDLFAVIAFCKVPIVRNTAELFRTLALNVKMAILPFAAGPVFAEA